MLCVAIARPGHRGPGGASAKPKYGGRIGVSGRRSITDEERNNPKPKVIRNLVPLDQHGETLDPAPEGPPPPPNP